MNNIESGKIANIEKEIDRKIPGAIDLLFISKEEIQLDYKDDLPKGVETLFNKVGDLLENHGEVESYKTNKESKHYPEKINYRTLNFRDGSYSIRIFEENDRSEIDIRITEGRSYGNALIRLRKDSAVISYGINPLHHSSEFGLDKIGNLIDLIGEKKQKEKDKQLCQEAFFEEVNNLQFGKVFTDLFKEKINLEDRKFDSERGEVFGENHDSQIPFKIVLSSKNGLAFLPDSKTGNINFGSYPLFMEILSDKESILSFLTTEDPNQKENKISLSLNIENLLPKSKSSFFLDIIQDFKKKVSEYQKNVESSRVMERKGEGAGDGGGAGSR